MFIQLVVSPLRKYGLVFVLCLFPLGQIAGIYQQFPAVFAARPVNLYDSPVQPLTGAADNRIILVIGFVLLIFGIVNVEIGIGEGKTSASFGSLSALGIRAPVSHMATAACVVSMSFASWAWEMPFLILYSLIAVIFSIASLSITMCDYYSITKRDCQH